MTDDTDVMTADFETLLALEEQVSAARFEEIKRLRPDFAEWLRNRRRGTNPKGHEPMTIPPDYGARVPLVAALTLHGTHVADIEGWALSWPDSHMLMGVALEGPYDSINGKAGVGHVFETPPLQLQSEAERVVGRLLWAEAQKAEKRTELADAYAEMRRDRRECSRADTMRALREVPL